jgi:hypothetical protein
MGEFEQGDGQSGVNSTDVNVLEAPCKSTQFISMHEAGIDPKLSPTRVSRFEAVPHVSAYAAQTRPKYRIIV